VLIFQICATVASALACLARRRLEAVSIASLIVAGLAVDLFALAIWLEIDNEAYGSWWGSRSSGRSGRRARCEPRRDVLDVETNVEDVPVLDDVGLPLEPLQPAARGFSV
jgi:hypothetical protein